MEKMWLGAYENNFNDLPRKLTFRSKGDGVCENFYNHWVLDQCP